MAHDFYGWMNGWYKIIWNQFIKYSLERFMGLYCIVRFIYFKVFMKFCRATNSSWLIDRNIFASALAEYKLASCHQ